MPKLNPEEARATCEALGLHMSRRGKDIIDHIAQLEAEHKALREYAATQRTQWKYREPTNTGSWEENKARSYAEVDALIAATQPEPGGEGRG